MKKKIITLILYLSLIVLGMVLGQYIMPRIPDLNYCELCSKQIWIIK